MFRSVRTVARAFATPFITVAAGAIGREHAAIALFGIEDASGVQHGLIEQARGGKAPRSAA